MRSLCLLTTEVNGVHFSHVFKQSDIKFNAHLFDCLVIYEQRALTF